MKKVLLVLMLIVVSACAKQTLPEGKETVSQHVELLSDKTTYLLSEDLHLQLTISSQTQIGITAVELELYPEEVISYEKQNQIQFEGIFERIEGPFQWTGTLTPNNPETINYLLRTQKEGVYTIGSLIQSEYGGKRELVTVCIVSSLDRTDIICPKKEWTSQVASIETNK
jgi:hypothetical protein